ncbi:MAG: hypothetical protein IKB09_03745 [Oscillospiraceae bacterium]|nr:hypothetical protein [Oscillospiraceae bacterium]
MCCLFGILDYGGKLSHKEKTKLLSVLSVACEERGTDATGIAYNSGDSLRIYKRPLPAHLLWFKIYDDTRAVMGHTRMTTQGSEKYLPNNHPFPGKAGDITFALAHNGVLSNDKRLRRQHDLPATKIETDSYIAVQLLEASGELSFASLSDMAEKLEGSFTITVMTDQDELYFIKGDNPMCIYHYEKLGFYIYASTEPILKTALKQLNMKLGKPTKIKLDCGEILKIDTDGRMTRSQFDDSKIFMGYSHWPRCYSHPAVWEPVQDSQASYIDDLKSVATYYGIWPEDIDEMLADGVTPEEIEELLNGA